MQLQVYAGEFLGSESFSKDRGYPIMSSSEKEWYLHVISAKQFMHYMTHVRQVIVGALLGDGCIIAPKKAELVPEGPWAQGRGLSLCREKKINSE